MKGMKTDEFDTGECGEELPWQIIENYEIEAGFMPSHHNICKHATPAEDGGVIIPLVVQCWNEGGHNSTVLCVDCLREAIAILQVGDAECQRT